MKIVFLEAVQNYGGARKSTLELAERLQFGGHEILIVDFWGSCMPFRADVERRGLTCLYLDEQNRADILFDRNPILMSLNYLRFIAKWLRYRKRIRSILKEFNAQIVIVNNSKALSILSFNRDYKTAYFARGWFMPYQVSFLEKMLCRGLIDCFIAVSQATRHAIHAGGHALMEDIFVVPNAVDSMVTARLALTKKHWHLEGSERPFTLLHCGGFLETKGQRLAIDIVKKLLQTGIPVKLLLVGIVYEGGNSKDYYQSILDCIEVEGLFEHIEVITGRSEVLDFFVQSDLLIHPSYTEGLPRVVMESMSLGNPVIGNAVGGMTDFILDNFTGGLTDFNRIDHYVDWIVRLQQDKELYAYMSENARHLIAKSYTVDNQMASFGRLLKRIES